jgi:GST-like protein
MTERLRLLGCRGCGSAIVEAALVLAKVPYDYEEVDYDQHGPERDRLLALNPLGQVPTLILRDGAVMTESAAILTMIDDWAPEAGLVPPAGSPERNVYLRWLQFIVGAIYPTFTYGDAPEKWVPAPDAAAVLRAATDRHREHLWSQIEHQIRPGPWFLGARFSALDLYVGVMTNWRPREPWFRAECPKLAAVAAEARRIAALEESLPAALRLDVIPTRHRPERRLRTGVIPAGNPRGRRWLKTATQDSAPAISPRRIWPTPASTSMGRCSSGTIVRSAARRRKPRGGREICEGRGHAGAGRSFHRRFHWTRHDRRSRAACRSQSSRRRDKARRDPKRSLSFRRP